MVRSHNDIFRNLLHYDDPAGKARKVCSDALGRLTQAFEDPAGLNYETDYAYDVLNNLLTVNQKGGSTNSANGAPAPSRTILFLSSQRNQSGIWLTGYSYDANGNVTSKTSPKPNQTGSATVVTCFGNWTERAVMELDTTR